MLRVNIPFSFLEKFSRQTLTQYVSFFFPGSSILCFYVFVFFPQVKFMNLLLPIQKIFVPIGKGFAKPVGPGGGWSMLRTVKQYLLCHEVF